SIFAPFHLSLDLIRTVRLFQSRPLDQGNGSDGQGVTLVRVGASVRDHSIYGKKEGFFESFFHSPIFSTLKLPRPPDPFSVPSSQACCSCDSLSISTVIIFFIFFNNSGFSGFGFLPFDIRWFEGSYGGFSGTVVAGVLRLCNTVFWVFVEEQCRTFVRLCEHV
ncbi:hypothetical protein A2U01_0038262, partial [Trifolium medium]|nr:hypothetical protein [Trifolium medium]